MYFVDSTGHTFYQQSFNYEPIGYEYYQNKYTFWIDNKDHSYCSINNYYIRPIYILMNEKVTSIDITIDSNIFSLISSVKFEEKFIKSLNELNIDESDLVNKLELDDVLELEVVSSDGNEEHITKYMYPFYVIANSFEPGTFFTNVLIHTTNEELDKQEYCSITVGAEFNEENEILYINGINMGIRLPHEIIRAVYNASYKNDVFDEDLYNEKLKEYLIQYMGIRGEIGNYNSAINSLKWFGWGDKIEIVSLLKTDNQFMTQFIRDYFDTNSDIIDSFKYFINTTMMSLIIWENKETGEYNEYDFNKEFFGENQPTLENLFEKMIPILYGGVGEETFYYRTYYNFIFGELLFKLAALKYYYEKYFLPVHLSIHNASLHHKVYANDIKMLSRSSVNISEPIIKMGLWKDPLVEFPLYNEIWLTEQIHIVDELYNEWNLENIKEATENNDYFYVHDTCGNIPIKFINYKNEPQLHVHMILEKISTESSNVLYVNNKINLLTESLKIYDINNKEINLNETFISYSNDDGKSYSPFFYGVDSLKNIVNGYSNKNVDVNKDDNGHYIVINNDNIYLTDKEQMLSYIDEYNNVYYVKVPSLDKTNIDLFNNIGDCTITYYKKILLRIKIENDKIQKCILVSDKDYDITENINILYSPSSEIFYESDFTFNPNDAEKYLSFVLYPKMFNNVLTDIMYNKHGNNLTDRKIDITYFINNKFRIRLLVNNRWHSYEFIVRMPDIQIEFGKLIYKYHDNELKFTSHFNQLSDLSENSLTFNSFMHEPRLARMNDVNFMENFLKYLKISQAKYIDGNIIPTNQFYYFIDIKFIDDGIEYSQRVYINDANYGKDLIVPRKYFNYASIFYLFLDKNMLYIFGETGVNDIYDVLFVDDYALIFDESSDGLLLYNDPNNYKKFTYNKETNSYETETSEGIVSFVVNESLRSDFNTFTSKYIETHNIVNNYKYLNQIHVYDLYRLNDHEGNNLISLLNNIDFLYHGIRFTHKSFLHGNTINISGNTNNLITNSEERETNSRSFLSGLKNSDNDTSYSYYSNYVNTYDDLVIYSAYEGDWLRPIGTYEDDEIIEPTGYVYYEEVNSYGMATGVFTTENINIVTDEKQIYFDSSYTESYKDFETLNDLRNWLYDHNMMYVNGETEYMLSYNESINNYNENLYLDRNNIDEDITNIYYTVELVKQNVITLNETIINPTYNDYINNIRPFLTRNSSDDIFVSEYIYKIRIRMYMEAHRIMNNIQRIYNGETIYEDGIYSVNLGGNIINVVPFYSEYDGNQNMMFNVKSLIQQPGIDWININDLDDYIYEADENDDYIELSDIEEINDNDIRTLLEHRKVLSLNVSSRLIEAIHAYEKTSVFRDNILKEENSNTLKLKFKINNKVLSSDTDVVDVKTILRCRYKENDINKYLYFDDYAEINSLLINENDSYYIDCGYDNENCYVKHIVDDNEILFDEFVVFFVLVPKSEEKDIEFNITFNPKVSLVYEDYDVLEYPTDSFNDMINYNDESFNNYNINDTIYKYGDCRKSKDVIALYNEFFDKNTVTFNSEYHFTRIDCKEPLNIDKNVVEYDMYLMHNNKNWYIIYISKDTCDKSLALYDYEPLKKEIIFETDEHQYKLIHDSSVKKFLINRYVYSSANGKNHFNVDDIIVGKVLNNERLPIDIFKTNKWEITPVSIGIDKQTATSTSNIDMCIFDTPMYNNEYLKGYYDVTYRYSLDRISTQQYKKYGTIRIG